MQKLNRGGVALCFTEAGSGAPPEVLVHGWTWLALFATHVFTDMPRLRAVCPHVVTGQTVGAGHFHQLEVPEQVNAMIERFLAVSLP